MHLSADEDTIFHVNQQTAYKGCEKWKQLNSFGQKQKRQKIRYWEIFQELKVLRRPLHIEGISWYSIMGYTAVISTAPRIDLGMKKKVGIKKAKANSTTQPKMELNHFSVM